MIDPRLQATLDTAAAADRAPSPAAVEAAEPAPRHVIRDRATAVAGLRAQLRAEVPGRDKAPAGPHRRIGGWLSADATTTSHVTGTSPWPTASHWHWLAAKGHVRQMPADLGPSFPHLFLSEAQIVHDLTAWSALDARGEITTEAKAMFGAVSGDAELTLYGTVLLYAHRREPVTLPAELEEFGLGAAVRNVPRVTFAIGLTGGEVVTALVNNASVVFSRRHRRGEIVADAAEALRGLLDPGGDWEPYPMTGPVTLPGEAVDALATGGDTVGVIDSEPAEDATDAERVADAEHRTRVGKGVRTALRSARIPSGAVEDIAGIATATTDAVAQVTLRDRSVDVQRGEPAALALAFLRGRGVVASYPSGSGPTRTITYVSGSTSGIRTGIAALRRVVTGV